MEHAQLPITHNNLCKRKTIVWPSCLGGNLGTAVRDGCPDVTIEMRPKGATQID